MDNETWLIEEGEKIIVRKAAEGMSALTVLEKLIYCLWVADYGMRNAGDLDSAKDLYPDFWVEGRRCAEELGFSKTSQAFSMLLEQFKVRYFEIFDSLCTEIRARAKR